MRVSRASVGVSAPSQIAAKPGTVAAIKANIALGNGNFLVGQFCPMPPQSHSSNPRSVLVTGYGSPRSGYCSPRGVILHQAHSRFFMGSGCVASSPAMQSRSINADPNSAEASVPKRFPSQPILPVSGQASDESNVHIQTKHRTPKPLKTSEQKGHNEPHENSKKHLEPTWATGSAAESAGTSPVSTRSGTPRSRSSLEGSLHAEEAEPSSEHSLFPDEADSPHKKFGLGNLLPIQNRLNWMVEKLDVTPPPPRPDALEEKYQMFALCEEHERVNEDKEVTNADPPKECTDIVQTPILTSRCNQDTLSSKSRRASYPVMASARSTGSLHNVTSPKMTPKAIRRSIADLRTLGTKTTSKNSKPAQARERSHHRSVYAAKALVQTLLEVSSDSLSAATKVAEDLLFESLPKENVQDLRVVALQNEKSQQAFLNLLRAEGNRMSRIRVAWHLAGSASAAQSIETDGIRCDEDHCHCGRYGRGGYVATSAAKASAYADSNCAGGDRCLFLVLALPDKEVIEGERGTRPARTAADLPSHPTEYCFVDNSRLHCVCRVDFSWASTGMRIKIATAGGHCSAWRKSSPSPLGTRGASKLTQSRTQNS
eukprot:gnl/MRDRNA2_/MRDRNA2_97713_c0_seq1.p1 gnl/MRDRNA2_/MRDRNA2_97713_c0~~gnl/MRDRNA2_/MRDRNA2_97713_c0_seq1.p1  ORF type:complete len:599 (+),score=95.32 gnl/MRDRNA2_/MRDRNA2_97713_c0_seq1:114-1910(+)